jgi:hypothetical protein
MISTIEDFLNGEIQYTILVSDLEGALNAGEFTNKTLIEQWFDFWTPIEILSATKGDNVTISDADKYLSAMESFTFRLSSVYYSICLYINGLTPLAGDQFNPTPHEYEIQFPFTEPDLILV